jgi:hypothetical protein
MYNIHLISEYTFQPWILEEERKLGGFRLSFQEEFITAKFMQKVEVT